MECGNSLPPSWFLTGLFNMNGGTMIHHDSPIPWDDDEQGIFLNVCFMQLSHINGISYINISYDMYIYTYVHIQ